MFIGHYGLAMAAKRAAPEASLGWLVAAAQFADLLWPVLLLTGTERVAIEPGLTRMTPLNFLSYPYSHSLTLLLVWGFVAALLRQTWKREHAGIVAVLFLVPSHWLLDFLMHRPDLPLTSSADSRLLGLGLWDSPAATLIIELGLLGFGLVLYLRGTTARDRIGRFGPWIYAAVLTLFWLGGIFGPPPPDVSALAYGALFLWITVPLAWWIDRHRRPAPA